MTKKKSVNHITEMRNELFTGVVDNMGLKGDLFLLIFYCIINTEEAIKKWTNQRNWQHSVHRTMTNQRNWQHSVHRTMTNKPNPKHNICWPLLCTNDHT
jgi:hypothetical protein